MNLKDRKLQEAKTKLKVLEEKLKFLEFSNLQDKALEQSKKNPYSGVTYDKSRKMWKATITFKKKIYHLGRYHDFDEALKVRKNAEQALFDDFLEWYYHEFKSKKA